LQVNKQTDRIEKTTNLRASRSRVWRALTTPQEFGAWFGAQLDAASFKPGARVTGRITTPGYDHLTLEMQIERMEPERVFSYRWHPYAVDPDVDYSAEPSTLVEFVLEDAGDGTELSVTESGFDKIPPERRSIAFRMNEGGWAEQLRNIERYVAK
jgi:uncharacterized protein YndB with AHSA1/START domain